METPSLTLLRNTCTEESQPNEPQPSLPKQAEAAETTTQSATDAVTSSLLHIAIRDRDGKRAQALIDSATDLAIQDDYG